MPKSNKTHSARPQKISVFKCKSSEELFCLVERLYHRRSFFKRSTLYRLGNNYFLVVACRECGNIRPNAAELAYICEHSRKICESAVIRIGAALFKGS